MGNSCQITLADTKSGSCRMTSLSRSTSREGASSHQILPARSVDDEQQCINIESSNSPSPSIVERFSKTTPPLPGQFQRLPSHSLLSTLSTPPLANRKSRFADAGTSNANIARASISMPLLVTKPSSTYKPSASRRPSTTMPSIDDVGTDKYTEGSLGKTTENDAIGSDDLEKTPSVVGQQPHPSPESYTPLSLPESSLRPPHTTTSNPDIEGDRLSFSSLYSLGSAIYSGATGGSSAPPSAASSNAGSVRSGTFDGSTATNTVPLSPLVGSARGEALSSATTATDPVSVVANLTTQNQISLSTSKDSTLNSNTAAKHLDSWNPGSLPRPTPRRSRSRTQQHSTGSAAPSSTASPNNSDRSSQAKPAPLGRIGVCALDVKARSTASRNILTRLQSNGEFDIVVFGDKVILDEEVENWPICEFLISFFSDGFPLDKAIAYSKLRKPFCINDLPMQKILWDRRICLRILDNMDVPTPKRIEVNRDGGPIFDPTELAERVYRFSGVKLAGSENGKGDGLQVTKKVGLIDDGDTLLVDGVTLKKPFVEKPISGEDHNIRIYFPKSHEGGGGRKLFRKIGNKSSEWDKDLIVPRALIEEGSSYLYEQFLHVENAEDIKAYTVGPDFCHAETRKSPVVDGHVRRNTHGKEIRYITSLTKEESLIATKIVNGFGQRVCGFDLLRAGNKSYVIDVNGWSFVKDNKEYYDKCASILKDLFVREKRKRDGSVPPTESQPEIGPDKGPPHRKSTISNPRATFKSMIKSPSMSRLTGHHLSYRPHGSGSPDQSTATTPVTSPPSVENEPATVLPKNFAEVVSLPPPAVSMTQPHTAEEQVADQPASEVVPQPASKHSWKLKGMVAVIRHADRTPKQKFKFTFHTQPFVDLLKGHQEEVLLKGEVALNSVQDAVKVAMRQGIEDPEKLQVLRTSLARKGAWAGTKVQIKPMFRKRKPEEALQKLRDKVNQNAAGDLVATPEVPVSPLEGSVKSELTHTRSDSFNGSTLSRFSAAENDLIIDKLQLIIKWGGEPTHAARYQSQDLGENMRNDLSLMNKETLNDVRVFTSSERRVSTSAQIWAASFLDQKEVAEDSITVRKDLLDDSNAAKDVMDKVKKKLKLLLREGHQAPPQFAWPTNTPEPSIVVRNVVELMNFHRKVMRHNFKKLSSGAAASLSALKKSSEGSPAPVPGSDGALAQAQAVASVQARWCCGEDPELFKERWEKLFSEFCDSEKVDPSKLSELYDTMKFDALHNRQFLEWIFTPSASILDEEGGVLRLVEKPSEKVTTQENKMPCGKHETRDGHGGEKINDKSSGNLAQRMGFGKKSVIHPSSPQAVPQEDSQDSYFKLFVGSGQTKAKQDVRLEKLRELYKYAKVLFDFVCPQEYGISDSEKLEIGLLTSLPLLKEIVKDLEEVQASEDAKSFIYFTKESHIYTLLNCILEGGVKTKIQRNAIPELDYLSHITFELYEAEDKDADTFAYSIRITITPGCHTSDPLDVQLDSKHSIGCAPRRSLTAHHDWKEVIETLRAKFHT